MFLIIISINDIYCSCHDSGSYTGTVKNRNESLKSPFPFEMRDVCL